MEVNDIEPICCGFCDAVFHISQQCCGFNHRANRDLFTQGKVMFICSECRTELNGRSIKRYLADTSKCPSAADTIASPDLSNQVQLLAEAVDKLGKKVDGLASKQPHPAGVRTNQLLTPSLRAWPKPGAKRPRMEPYDPASLAAGRGTRAIDFTDLSIGSIVPAPTPAKFWLYLSGFQPLISPDDVQKIVSRCLDTNLPCDVIRLVPKGKDVSNMSFVSFKIGIEPSLKERALLASTWLDGLVFREFVDQSKNSRHPPIETMDNYHTPTI